MSFGKCLYRLIKKRGYSLRGYGQMVGLDSGNLCKMVNGNMDPPSSVSHVWRVIGALNPEQEESDELIKLAYEAAKIRLSHKWGQAPSKCEAGET